MQHHLNARRHLSGMQRLASVLSSVTVGVSLLLFASTAHAQVTEAPPATFLMRGYGEWVGGIASNNPHLGLPANELQLTQAELGLMPVALIGDQLLVQGALAVKTVPGRLVPRADLGFAFAQWTVNDALRLRAGMPYMPFGLYAETQYIGTYRPFLSLAPSIYGTNGFFLPNFFGAQALGSLNAPAGMSVEYDAWAGAIRSNHKDIGGELYHVIEPEDEEEEEEEAEGIDDLIDPSYGAGGRLVLRTPWSGLSLGVSSWAALADNRATGSYDPLIVALAHGEWVASRLKFRMESGVRAAPGVFVAAGYGESTIGVARDLDVNLRLEAARMFVPNEAALPKRAAAVLYHASIAAGFSYWFTSAAV